MRKARFAVTIGIVAASLTGGVAASASADPPENYGQCVSSGQVDPSADTFGPANTNAPSDSGAAHAWVRSNQHSRFSGGIACSP